MDNKKCIKCQRECKQTDRVTIVACPNYIPINKGVENGET